MLSLKVPTIISPRAEESLAPIKSALKTLLSPHYQYLTKDSPNRIQRIASNSEKAAIAEKGEKLVITVSGIYFDRTIAFRAKEGKTKKPCIYIQGLKTDIQK